MAYPDLGFSSCPLPPLAFMRQDGSNCLLEVKWCQNEEFYQFLNLNDYLLLENLNVSTLASISEAYL